MELEPDAAAQLQTRLDVLIALQLVQLRKTLDDADLISALAAVGQQPREIGALLGLKSNTVSAALSRARERPRRRGQKGK